MRDEHLFNKAVSISQAAILLECICYRFKYEKAALRFGHASEATTGKEGKGGGGGNDDRHAPIQSVIQRHLIHSAVCAIPLFRFEWISADNQLTVRALANKRGRCCSRNRARGFVCFGCTAVSETASQLHAHGGDD